MLNKKKYIVVFFVLFLLAGCSIDRFDDIVGSDKAVLIAHEAESIVNSARVFIPEPFGSIVSGLMGVGVGLVRSSHNRRVARRLASAIELNKNESGVLDFSNPVVRSSLNSHMGTTGRRIVDEAQGKKSRIPF